MLCGLLMWWYNKYKILCLERFLMLECTVKRTHKFWLAFFLVALVAQGIIFVASPVLADRWSADPSEGAGGAGNLQSGLLPGASTPVTQGATGTDTANKSASQSDTKPTSASDSCWLTPLTCLGAAFLNGITDAMAWLANGAAGLFVWIVQPANISGPTGLLNKASIYELWKFIRDFFNIFFILILLLSAFATVFQVENFSIRKIFLNILLAALVINFSFPITRFLIDLTNVPMYYFLNAILPGTDGGLGFTKVYLSSTGMAGIKLATAVGFTKAFLNCIFMFLFAISLLVLAVMLLIRFIALTLLLVLSPIGFAASLMPGFQSVGSKWWEEFWRYSLFGPSAALMLLVAMRFQNELATDGTIDSFNKTLASMSAGSAAGSAMSLVAFYTIPLVLIWAAIGMANKSSVAGAGLVVGLGYGAARKVGGWGKKMVVGGTKAILPTNVAKGVATGVKDGLKGGKLFGLKVMPKGLTPKELKKKGEEREAYWKGVGSGGFAGGDKEKMKLFDKRVTEKVKDDKENKVSRSTHLKNLDSKDEFERVVAATSLSQMDDGIQTMDELTKILHSLSDPITGKLLDQHKERAASIVAKTDKKIIASTTTTSPTGVVTTSGLQNLNKVIETLGKDNKKVISDLIGKLEDTAFTGTGADWGPLLTTMNGIDAKLAGDLKTKMVKEGGAKVLVEHLASQPGMNDQTAVQTVLGDIKSAKDIVASINVFQDARYGAHAKAFMQAQVAGSPQREQEIRKVAAQESSTNPDIFFR